MARHPIDSRPNNHPARRRISVRGASWFLTLCLAAGCDKPVPSEPKESSLVTNEPTSLAPSAPGGPVAAGWTEAGVHEALKQANPGYNGQAMFHLDQGQVRALQLSGTGVTNLAPVRGMRLQALDLRQTAVSDLGPLEGQPLVELYLEEAPVADLSPLRGMRVVKLYLSQTKVENLDPLRGMPLMELNLLGTPVRDLGPLSQMPLEMLWLNETPVSDISPLKGCPLVSLTLHRTAVRDLTPLAGSNLQRLHIGETPVTDLRPLRGLPLTRLVFTPARITEGLEAAREMSTLREIGPTLESVMPPSVFWEQHQAGAFR